MSSLLQITTKPSTATRTFSSDQDVLERELPT